MDQIECEGGTVQEAIDAALRQLGRREEDVEIEVLSKGSKGLFGLGAKTAQVRVKVKMGGVLPPEAIARASDFLVQVIKLMGMDVEVEGKCVGNELYLEVDQGAGGILIGRRGLTLAAISYLMERIVCNAEQAQVKVFVDVAGYLERRRRTLVTQAQEMADEARRTGQEIEGQPMTAFERKVIHTTLHNDQTVRTFSRGEGLDRRVVIAPGGKGADGQPATEPGQDDEGRGNREQGFGGGRERSFEGPRGGGGGRSGGRGGWGGGRGGRDDRGRGGRGRSGPGGPRGGGRSFDRQDAAGGEAPAGNRGGWTADPARRSEAAEQQSAPPPSQERRDESAGSGPARGFRGGRGDRGPREAYVRPEELAPPLDEVEGGFGGDEQGDRGGQSAGGGGFGGQRRRRGGRGRRGGGGGGFRGGPESGGERPMDGGGEAPAA